MKKIIIILSAIFLSLCVVCTQKDNLPNHPSQLEYKALNWEVPLGDPYRKMLSNGLTVYIAEDKILPVVSMSFYFKAGNLLDPSDKVGLSQFASHLMRTGGTEKYSADVLDALLEQYAIDFSLSCKNDKLVVKTKFLSKYADTALVILEEILFHPVFEHSKIEKERAIMVQGIKHRFDNPGPILSAAYMRALYPNQTVSRVITEKSLNKISRNDCIEFQKRFIVTDQTIASVAGDFETESICKKLELIFPQRQEKAVPITFKAVVSKPDVKILVVHKEISQAYVRIGSPLFARPHPDYYPLRVFNNVLGGGGFTARLVQSVRSNAGLTYSIYSTIGSSYRIPSTFFIQFFTKHESLNKAIDLSIIELDSMLQHGMSATELSNTKKILVDGFPSMFRSKRDVVDTYAWNEYIGRNSSHYEDYPKKINAITLDNVKKATSKHIKTDNLTFVIVGDTTKIFNSEKSTGFTLIKDESVTIITPAELEK